MSTANGPKEQAYDAHIAPLMTQIIDLCREHKINAFATFALDRTDEDALLKCTTALPVDEADEEGCDLVDQLRLIARPPAATLVAFTITNGPPPQRN